MHINYILIIVAFLLTGCASKSASYYYTQKQLQHGDLRFHHTLRINEYLNAFEQDWLVVPANQEIVVRKDSLTQKDTPVGEHVFKQIAVKTRRLSREESRKPIAICFVIDISGSMSGENIDDTRVALKNAVRELRNGDRISIVLFNHESYVLTSNVLISHESIISLLTNIDKIQAIGGTDIELGLVTGYEEMAKFPKTVNQRLLLLTDGRSNVQARSPQEIANQASIDYSENVRISTIGLGHGVDETVLRDIAEKGGGHYYFANNGKTLTKFLREDLHTTIVPVAKDVHLAINLGSTYELINIYGPQPEKDSSSNNLKVNLGELNANDWRILILELKRVSSQAKGIQVSGDYFSIAQQKSSDIVQSVQPAQAQSNINKYVLRNSIIFANVQALKEASRLNAEGKYQDALSIIDLQLNNNYVLATIDDDEMNQQERINLEKTRSFIAKNLDSATRFIKDPPRKHTTKESNNNQITKVLILDGLRLVADVLPGPWSTLAKILALTLE